jgi:nucleotide-binding universal stress UspA family protein
MTSFRTILVPLTLDPESHRALPHAQRLAELCGAGLVLATWSFDDGEAALAQHRLEEIAADLGGDIRVEAHCSEELSPAASLLRSAERNGALVVMATHAPTAVGEMVLGSTAQEVLRSGRHPVVLVGPRVEEPRHGPAGPVVACVDGSDLAESALPVAVALATRIGAPLELVEVIDPELVDALAASGRDVLESGYLASTVTAIPEALRPVYEVLHGRPAAAIVDHAGARAELVAMATHGRSGPSKALLGSVAMGVVRHARCPVLVVPPQR